MASKPYFSIFATMATLFLQSCFAVGTVKSIGIFLEEINADLNTSATDIGITLGVFSGMAYFAAPFVAIIYQRVDYPRTLLISGSILTSIPVVLSSLVTEKIELSLALAVAGLGNSLVKTTATNFLSEQVGEKFSLFYGISTSGFAFGMTLIPLLSELLMGIYGWRGAMMILGGLMGNMVPWSVAIQGRAQHGYPGTRNEDSLTSHPTGDDTGEKQLEEPQKRETKSGTRNINGISINLLQEDESERQSTEELEEMSFFGHEAESMPLLMPTEFSSEDSTTKIKRDVETSTSCSKLRSTMNVININRKFDNLEISLKDYIQHKLQNSVIYNDPWLGFIGLSEVFQGMLDTAWHAFLIPRAVQRGLSPMNIVVLTSTVGIGNFIGRISAGFTYHCHCNSYTLYFGLLVIFMAAILTDIFVSNAGILIICSCVCGMVIGGISVLAVVIVRDRVPSSSFATLLGILVALFGTGAFFGDYLSGLIADKLGTYDASFLFIAGLNALVFLVLIPPRCVKRKDA